MPYGIEPGEYLDRIRVMVGLTRAPNALMEPTVPITPEITRLTEIMFLWDVIYRRNIEPYTQRITVFERFKAAS